MNFYVGVTDYNWFDFLRREPREDVNFWKPLGGGTKFGAVPSGAPFLLKLKKPYHCIAGIGFFTNQIDLPISMAWDMFGPRNGFGSYQDFAQAIQKYRVANGKSPEVNPLISCLVLTAPVFFRKPDWIPAPESWGNSIVTGKVYDTKEPVGAQLWAAVSATQLRYQQDAFTRELATDAMALESPGIYREALTKVRVGQGAFRALVTQAYEKKCAISGEKTLPVLEAAHIQPFSQAGPNSVGNGLLLRSDLHKLFDKHYITIDADDKAVLISSRIKEEFQNGKEYYRFHGEQLKVLPKLLADQPALQYLQHHNGLFMP
ncbi:HNH endonuclease [Hymenobacter sp. HMF4947]|uniref:HNH endonuclease n=1 Tax=Hymenobacter ginkgonis TaxID=2682976 RepID=A0A7K1TIW2_9BACT|nr:HNH endonuclease [Hymenobacter ginkgonis]MVN78266.1 HNH endonuclease [Hymenobacter ginkgonis]